MTSYAPLERFLAEQTDARIRLSFREVEQVLGAPLPPSARRHQPWWANTDTHSQARAWMRRGWRTEAVDVPGEKLTFVRAPATPERGTLHGGVAEAVSPGLQTVAAVVRWDALGPAARWYIPEVQEQFGVDVERAVIIALELSGRRALIDRAAAQSIGMTSDSAEMIRQDRDSH